MTGETETPAQQEQPAPDRRTMLASGGFGLLMILGAVLLFADAAALPESSSEMGPAAMPRLVAVLLAVAGIGLVVQAGLKLGASRTGTGWQPRAGLRVLALVVALVLFAVLLPLLGYVVTATALFVATALLLGAPRSWQLLAYGWALAAAVFLVFDRLIGLSLPSGPWGF